MEKYLCPPEQFKKAGRQFKANPRAKGEKEGSVTTMILIMRIQPYGTWKEIELGRNLYSVLC